MKELAGNYRSKTVVKLSIVVGWVLVLGLSSPGFAQELSRSDIENLLNGGVAQKRMEDLIKERGIDFELTDDVKLKFSKLGAGPEVIRSLEYASVISRIKRLKAEKSKPDGLAKEQGKTEPGETAKPPAKADTAADKQLKSGEAQKKPEATAKAEQKSILSGKPDASAPKVIELPSQLKETADQVLALEKIAIQDGEVSGELVNRSSQGVYGVDLQVLYSWRWNNDFHPGRDDPGRAEYFRIEKEISPGQRVPFVHKPSPPLPARKDGTFDISIKVIGFTRIFRETKGRESR
ncbi:MAG TPA: hypothetical protein VEO92_01295 [Candidatus Nitrosocosmicus sp.]|nr:hypothetical protein [Candidatus Nitrosocosmicus sp.]